MAAIAATGLVVLPLAVSASAQPAVIPPTVTLGPVGVTESSGALVTATINPEGTDTLYAVMYGPAGGALSQTTSYSDAGSGTAPVTVSIAVDQLAPATTYSYAMQAFSNALGQGFLSSTGTVTTAAAPTGPPAPIIPPANPPANGIFGFCSSDASCVNDINGDRAAQENLVPLALPSNWSKLTQAEQIFVWTNLERTSRGEAAIPNLVNTYNAAVQAGVANDTDPSLANLPGHSGAVWAGAFPTTLGAMYGWLYDDGPGGANLDCTTATAKGCWGHRDNLLPDPATFGANPAEMDAYGGPDNAGQQGYAALLTVNPDPTPAANIVMSWASEQPFLAGAGAPPASPVIADHVSTRVCANCTPPLTYQGGKVAGTATTSGQASVTEIFWAPTGAAAFPGSYISVVRGYVNDLNETGATTSDVFSVDSEYYQTVNGQHVNIAHPIGPSSIAVDSNAFPTNGCTPDPGYTACVTDAQLQAELTSFLATIKKPEDLANIYPVFLPPGVETVDGTGKATVTSAADYCGYHNDFASPSGGVVLYADEPYPPLNGCATGQSPNNDPAADSEISILSAELNEAITDPTGAGWADDAGNEIGDECDSTFGIPLGSTDAANPGTTLYNQVINGHHFYTQEEFSNAEAAAAGPTQGCVQDESQVTAATTTPASATDTALARAGAPKRNTVTVQTSNSTVSQGARATITVQVTGPNGAAVAGDPITLDVAATAPTTAECGTLSAQHGVTGSNGKWDATYTASKANLPCAVVAIEALTGQSAQAAIGQGTVARYSPVVKVQAPSRATLGHLITVHATVTNPGDAIKSSLIEVSLASQARPGLAAGHLHLSYLSRGRWITVPLSGSSSSGSVIAGSLTGLPVTLAAHTTEAITLRLTVDGPASASALQSPLNLKVALNQFNRANRSADLLCYKIVTLHLVRKG